MMRTVLHFSIGVLLCIGLFACSSDDDGNLEDTISGTYNGTFTVIYTDGTTMSNPVTLNLNADSSYDSTSSPNYVPAGGSGTFEYNALEISFTDVNGWTANFDWNLILNGTYTMTINGNELIISANKNNVGTYTYALIKD